MQFLIGTLNYLLLLLISLFKRCYLNEFYLRSNRFTGVTGEKVAFALKDNTSIKVLDLSNNYLGL